MSYINLVGVIICVTIFLGSVIIGDGSIMLFNVISLMIVFSGTFGATFLSFPFSRIRAGYYVAINAYKSPLPEADDIVNSLLDLSIRSKYDGVLSLERSSNQSSISFLKGALSLLVDGYKEDEIQDLLITEMYFFKQRRQANERVFRTMAKTAPAFGIIGSVIGLIGMLTGIGDTSVILKTIPIALTSTLYGIVLSNFIFTPIAENVHTRTQDELMLQKLIINGVMAIRNEQNPYKLEKKLAAFLTPASRRGREKSFEEIRKKHIKMRLDNEESSSAS